ncbi:MAG: protein kinase [Myxococcales bacterium]|nr:protein kinase [Myxococcales bacterium]
MQPPTDPLLGAVLDERWQIDAPLGAGGMGAVYRGRQLNVDRPVAIKVLHALAAHDSKARERFANEARVIASLQHPHIIRLFDVGTDLQGRPWLAMELLEGEPLDARLARLGPLPVDLVLGVLADVADALVEAHGRGIIHRDLKPANIFLQRVGDRDVVKVLDFGVAQVADHRVTTTGRTPGTPAYVAPEQAQGAAIGPGADLYALGVVAYELLTGTLPFDAPTALALIFQHVQLPPPPMADRNPERPVPPPVEALVRRLLAKRPEERPPSAAALRDEVAALRRALEVHTEAQAPAWPKPTTGEAPTRWPLWAAGLVLLAGAGVWFALRPDPPDQPRLDASPTPAATAPDAQPSRSLPQDAGVPDAARPDARIADASAPDAQAPEATPPARRRRAGRRPRA